VYYRVVLLYLWRRAWWVNDMAGKEYNKAGVQHTHVSLRKEAVGLVVLNSLGFDESAERVVGERMTRIMKVYIPLIC